MDWNYAELSRLARENGGPEKLVEILVDSGRKKTIPWVGIAFAGGIVFIVGAQKVISHFSRKGKASSADVVAAKEELIAGIKEYDSTHDVSEDTPKQTASQTEEKQS